MKKILSIAVASSFAALTLTQGASALSFHKDVLSKLPELKDCSTNECIMNKYNIKDALGENCTLSKEILETLLQSGKLPSCLNIEYLNKIFTSCGDGNCIIDFFGGNCQTPEIPDDDKPEQDIPEQEKPEENIPEIPEQDTDTPAPEVKPEAPETPPENPEENTPDVEIPDNTPDIPLKPEIPENDGNTDNETQTPPSYENEYSAFVNEVVGLVNKEREANGLSALSASDTSLMNAASQRAKEQAQLFSHTRPSGQSWDTVLGEFGVIYRGAGENVAYGQSTPAQVVSAWMNSQGHRENILNPNYKNIGVGVYYQNGTYYWAQLFTY